MLDAVSTDGRVKQRLVSPATDVREPAWGPLPRPMIASFRAPSTARSMQTGGLMIAISPSPHSWRSSSPAARRNRLAAHRPDRRPQHAAGSRRRRARDVRRGDRRRDRHGVPGAARPGAGTAATRCATRTTSCRKRSVFFDFDSFVVKDEYRPLVEAHARYLARQSQARATIQGNTDERGSREYNIALGQRRADAVKRMMTLLGAQDGRSRR